MQTVSLFNIRVTILASGLENHQDVVLPISHLKDRYLCHIWETPHFSLLQGKLSWEEYGRYILMQSQPEHSVKKYRNLSETFCLSELERNPIIVQEETPGEYLVQDGVHRLALFLHKTGERVIPRKYLIAESGKKLASEAVTFSQRGLKQVRHKLKKADAQSFDNGWNVSRGFGYGYHGFSIGGLEVEGQREPLQRVEAIQERLNMSGRSILDLGCATGGMLLHIPNPAKAIGWDFDRAAISAANSITKELSHNAPELARRFTFQQVDLDAGAESLFAETILRNSIDTVFLLSIGSWVKNWRKYYSIAANSGAVLVLETNNDREGAVQLEFLRHLGVIFDSISSCSPDDRTGNTGRRTYVSRTSGV